MSNDDDWVISKREPSRIEKFEYRLKSPLEFCVSIGSTFFSFPEITVNRVELFAIDFLWIHIGLYRR